MGWEKPSLRDDEIGLIRVLSGTWFGDLANPDPEERIEIETKYGIISGRIDIQQKLGEVLDYGQGNLFAWGEDKTIPGEIKLTWKSPRKDISDFTQYVNQILGYMCAKNITNGRLFVLHVTSYEKNSPPMPKLRAFEINVTVKELAIIKDRFERNTGIVLDKDNIPSIDDHNKNECNYCPYHVKKGGSCKGGDGKITTFVPLKNI